MTFGLSVEQCLDMGCVFSCVRSQVKVNSGAATVISPGRVVGSSAAGRFEPDSSVPDDVPSGNFLRQSAGGSFELSGYTPGNGSVCEQTERPNVKKHL